MSTGEVANVSQTNWDLAFEVSGFGSTIRINGSKDVQVYAYPNGDTSAWGGTIDTAGISTWPQLVDSDTSWAYGALSSNANASDPFDLGWGNYNPTTHQVTGDSIFVIKLSNGAWKKLHIIRLASGTYYFRHADLDGGNLIHRDFAKSDYAGKNFAYYSLQNDMLVDREPANTDWDLVFSSYVGELFPGTWYGVTGALQNKGVEVAEAHPVHDPTTYTNYSAHPFSAEMNTIGYDWKSFNMSTFQFELEDSLAYFIKDVQGNIWRLVFTGFSGSSTGMVYFTKELVAAVHLDETSAVEAIELFPNPAAGQEVSLVYTLREADANLEIFNLNGRRVHAQNLAGTGFNQRTISLQGIPAGLYIVSLSSGKSEVHRKLIIR